MRVTLVNDTRVCFFKGEGKKRDRRPRNFPIIHQTINLPVSDVLTRGNPAIYPEEKQSTQSLGKGFRLGTQFRLTKSSTHPHGIKVRLESGEVGRVKEILE